MCTPVGVVNNKVVKVLSLLQCIGIDVTAGLGGAEGGAKGPISSLYEDGETQSASQSMTH